MCGEQILIQQFIQMHRRMDTIYISPITISHESESASASTIFDLPEILFLDSFCAKNIWLCHHFSQNERFQKL